MGDKALVLVGAEDEAVDTDALRAVFAESAPRAQVMVLPRVNHFGVFSDAAALNAMTDWLRALP
jgi:hypothetical protein